MKYGRKTDVSEKLGYLSTKMGKGAEQGFLGGIRCSVLKCLLLGKISNESLM